MRRDPDSCERMDIFYFRLWGDVGKVEERCFLKCPHSGGDTPGEIGRGANDGWAEGCRNSRRHHSATAVISSISILEKYFQLVASLLAIGLSSAIIINASSARRFAPHRLQPVLRGNKRLKRKPRKITISVPEPIPTPPQAPSILRCVKIRVDGLQRVVKVHFYPPFNDLFKKPQSEQKVKDKTLIMDYLKTVMNLDDIQYIPSGVASTTSNPWSDKAPKKGGDIGSYSQDAISICSICHECETDHSKCIKAHMMAKHGLME